MRILVETHHPAHVHLFKYPIRNWQAHGHEVMVAGRDRGIMVSLAAAYPWIPYHAVTRMRPRNRFPLSEFIERGVKIFRMIRKFSPNVFVSAQGSYSAASRVAGIPNVVFADTEHQSLNHWIVRPVASVIYTPQCFWKDLGKKQRRYDGYHELSFLRPEQFAPRPEVLEKMRQSRAYSYTIIRLSSWNTFHDIGKEGARKSLADIMAVLKQYGPVWIMPEAGMPSEFEPFRLTIPPDWFHDAIAFAKLVVSEGASTASEAVCLGTPAVYINKLEAGTLQEQEKRYGLVCNFTAPGPALEKIKELLTIPNLREEFAGRRTNLLKEKIDVSEFITRAVEEAVGKG